MCCCGRSCACNSGNGGCGNGGNADYNFLLLWCILLSGLFPALPGFVGVSSIDGSATTVVVGMVMVVVLVSVIIGMSLFWGFLLW